VLAKFRENRPMDVKRLWWDKQITRQKYNSLRLSLQRYAGDCKKSLSLVWLGFSRVMCTRMIPEASAAMGFSVGLHWR